MWVLVQNCRMPFRRYSSQMLGIETRRLRLGLLDAPGSTPWPGRSLSMHCVSKDKIHKQLPSRGVPVTCRPPCRRSCRGGDRLGVLLAYPDRRRVRLRRLVRRWPRLVHLREQPEPRDRPRLRRAVHRDPHRDHGRERHFQERRATYGIPLGDAALKDRCDCVQHSAFRSAAPRAASAGCRFRRRHLSAGSSRARARRPYRAASGSRCAPCGPWYPRASCPRRA